MYSCLAFGGIANISHESKKIDTAPLLKLEANSNEGSPGKSNLSFRNERPKLDRVSTTPVALYTVMRELQEPKGPALGIEPMSLLTVA